MRISLRTAGLILVVGTLAAPQVNAIPTVTLALEQAGGTASQCATLGGTYSGSQCSFTTTSGVVNVAGAYGDFVFTQSIGVGYPLVAMPGTWLNSVSGTLSASTLTVTLVASDYSLPAGAFPMQSTAAVNVNLGMSVSLDSYFDVTNSGIAGAGISLLSEDWAGFVSGSAQNSVDIVNDGDGLYSVSWISTTTRATSGANFLASSVSAVIDQTPVALIDFDGGSMDEPILIESGMPVGSISDTIGEFDDQDDFYEFSWGGGAFSATAEITGAAEFSEYVFKLLNPDTSVIASALLNTASAFTGNIALDLLPGVYTIGLAVAAGGDPPFTITFDDPIGVIPQVLDVPSPDALALFGLGLLSFGALRRRVA